jgi:hypothetical protein
LVGEWVIKQVSSGMGGWVHVSVNGWTVDELVNRWMERMRGIVLRRAEMNMDEEMPKVIYSERNAFFRI